MLWRLGRVLNSGLNKNLTKYYKSMAMAKITQINEKYITTIFQT